MAVFRVEHTKDFTIMNNRHLRDKRLSLKAKGLLSQILSLPEDWDYTLSGLAAINAEGRGAVGAALRELERAGYLVRARVRDEKGRLLGTEYTVREEPSCPASPALDEPAPDKPALEDRTQLNTDSNQKKDLPSTDPIPFPSAPSPEPARPKRRIRNDPASYSREDMDRYRELIRKNIGYESLLRSDSVDPGRLDEMVELMTETVCSTRRTIRISGNELPQSVVKSRLLKLDEDHIRFVFDCLRENTTRVRNIRQYLLAVLYNAPATMENHYAALVNHDLHAPPDHPDHPESCGWWL